jgi:hypothetical protein
VSDSELAEVRTNQGLTDEQVQESREEGGITRNFLDFDGDFQAQVQDESRFVYAGSFLGLTSYADLLTHPTTVQIQGLAARGAKEAMWEIAKACYVENTSALSGCRPVLFLHDEFILEVPANVSDAHDASATLSALMVEGMRKFVPDVPVSVEPTLMKRWYKEAGPVYDAKSRLVPWEPKPTATAAKVAS